MRLPRFFGALALVLAGQAARAGQDLTVTVAFTSDVHAHVLPYDDVRQRPARGSLAQVATFVRQLRRDNPLTVVLDGGDALQGTPLSHYVLTEQLGDGQDPTVAVMNLVGYDAAVLGNHEFNYGLVPLRRAITQSRFPWLAANMAEGEAAGVPVKPWVILKKGKVRIGVLGLTNPHTPFWDPPEHWQPLTFLDPLRAAERAVRALRPQVDLLVVVAHTGFEQDLETGAPNGSEEENFAWRLAQIPGIDLLLTGHTHRNIPPRKLQQTWVAQPGRWAEFVTVFAVRMRNEGKGYRVVRVEGRNQAMTDLAPDPQVSAALAPLAQQVRAELARPLGELAVPLRIGGLPVEDDAGLDLIHQVQLWATGAQLSLAAPVANSVLEFAPGPLTPRLAHALYVYPNSLVVVRVTARELKDILEHAVRGWLGVRCAGEGPLELVRDEELPPYNFDTVEGITYLVDPTAPQGEKVRDLRVAGRAVQPHDTFTLVVNSYRAAGGGGYPYLRQAPKVKVVDKQVVDLLVSYFQQTKVLRPEATENWFFAPKMQLMPESRR